MTTNPLANLRDIHLPDPVSFWPLAKGWYILAFILVTTLLIGGFYIIKQRQRRRVRSLVLTQLQRYKNTYQEQPDRALAEISALLKQTALAAYERRKVAGLTGRAWLAFLDETGKTHDFTCGIGKVLIDAPYQKQMTLDIEPLIQLITQWIKRNI